MIYDMITKPESSDQKTPEKNNTIEEEPHSDEEEETENKEPPQKVEEKKEELDVKSESSYGLDDDNNDYKHMKEELDKATNFIDYFLTVGLPPKTYLENWLYENDAEELNEKYKDILQPKVTSYFPPFEKHTIAFDDSVTLHCFPNGFKAIKSKTQPKIKIFSFILDNNYFNLNFPQKYLTCLICYENILKYKQLYDQNRKLTTEYNIQNKLELKNYALENNNNKDNIKKNISEVKDPEIYIPKCLMIMSLYPYFAEYETILTEIYNYSLIVSSSGSQDKLTRDKREKTFSIPNNKNESIVPSSLTLANVKGVKDIIEQECTEIIIPIDKIIENLLIELPVPPRGIFNVEYTLINKERELKQNLMNQLPLVNINLKRLFTFEVKEIVDLYLYLFLETRILFFSEDIQALNMYIFGLLALLYPFQYQYQIVTILPEENFQIIESITPFIAGINMAYTEDFFDSRDLTLSDSICIVDIDNNKVSFANEVPEIPEFPKKHRKLLENNLQALKAKYFKDGINNRQMKTKTVKQKQIPIIAGNKSFCEPPISENSLVKEINKDDHSSLMQARTQGYGGSIVIDERGNDNNDFEIIYEEELEELNNPFGNFKIDYDFNKEFNELFFNFNANLLAGYNKYLNLDFYSENNAPCLEVLFKVEDYLNQVNPADRQFYDKFISETQIFGDFLYTRMIPKNTREKIQILAFDEKINEISSSGFLTRGTPSVFINSTEYNFVNKYKVQKARNLTKEEIEFCKIPENKLKLLNNGIIIKEQDDKIIFEYPIFPNLTSKYFFKNNITEYFLPMNLNENVESINTDIVAKSHLGSVAIQQNDMDNYIYLCWIQMWAMTFWYCDEKEKRYRFQELLKVLQRTKSHEMEIFNLLFDALSLYGEDYMVLKLYDYLLTLHLNPSFKVHNIVMKLLDKKKIEGKIRENLQNAFKEELKRVYTNNGFRKRTFKSKFYGNILTEDIIFYAFDSCMNCQEDINLEQESLNFKAMDRELTWIKCKNCGNAVLPKITVQFGKEINKIGKMRQNTCKYDSIVLFSPYFLKGNYSSQAIRACGVKFDVEGFMLKYGNIFWNSLWYFKLKNLEYDFMLPYEFTIKQVDDYFDVIIGEEDEKLRLEEEGKKNKFSFDLSAFKPEKFEVSIGK